jgi:hypothetical protein
VAPGTFVGRQADDKVTDVLQSLPSVSADINGNVSIRQHALPVDANKPLAVQGGLG